MYKNNRLLIGIILAASLSACTSIPVKDSGDPWESWNRSAHSFNDDLDGYLLKPVAKGYQWITPSFVDTSISNVFSNINDIGVTINDLLQGKMVQTGMDLSRFLVNSTIGIGGLIDVASMINLPKHHEDFGQTLGVWGIPTGPYLVLPFFGPSSPRGVGGLLGDASMNPISYLGLPYLSAGLFVGDTIDQRSDNLGTERIANEAAAFGRYEFFRDAYITKREALVTDGSDVDDDPFLDLVDAYDESDNPD
jgi:phospholipid-binding lipoprotein MlaA